MAVGKRNVNGAFYLTYPISDVFLKERNYFVFEGVQDDTYIKTVKIGNKTLNFGKYALYVGSKFYLDVSAYYAKYLGKFIVVITYENASGDDISHTININANTYNFYDPYKEIVQNYCGESESVIITPPHRMLFIDYFSVSLKSLFVGKLSSGRVWNINGINYDSKLTMVNVPITKNGFIAELKTTSGGVLTKVNRIVDLLDTSRDWVQVTWSTRWGFDVSHVFYLDTYATDKDDVQEVESEYLYKEHSKHVINGSFYIDNIREPYDLWYFQTLNNSELVTLKFWKWIGSIAYYMPNGTAEFNGVKITGCNIKDAVVDGVAQSTITFDFEMR